MFYLSKIRAEKFYDHFFKAKSLRKNKYYKLKLPRKGFLYSKLVVIDPQLKTMRHCVL